jgi:hypothetical protein
MVPSRLSASNSEVGATRGDLAEAQHHDPVGDLEDVRECMRDEDDPEALILGGPDHREHFDGLTGAEVVGRLVGDDDLAGPGDGSPDRDGLPLASGTVMDL